ncbi:hypothetical protein ACFQ09_06315 [Massilia norwichensis]|jgi:hypothetical protein|uniref:Uncharacterized protein n=1 Tax=Massilia norwichensis TaxID=1442366 RepID=A0ABT2AEQ4_9BURK|nr:hypothetical protein [Massilia norwichensis]MCS0592512.1 hypothetical protein [Massilia norwichensis]
MTAMREFSDDNDPPIQPQQDDSPRFGRLLAVLALAILLIVAITVVSEKYLA